MSFCDIKVENKFAVLKRYSEKYNLKLGFTKDYDKNDLLYFSNIKYIEDINNENCINIKNVLYMEYICQNWKLKLIQKNLKKN